MRAGSIKSKPIGGNSDGKRQNGRFRGNVVNWAIYGTYDARVDRYHCYHCGGRA